MAAEKDRIAKFWVWFVTNIQEFLRPKSTEEPFWDLALEQLKKVDEHFCFELSRERHPVCEFMVTAQGQVSSFPIAEQFVRQAPNLEGWSFIALKPPQGFQFTTTYEGTLFDRVRCGSCL